MKLIVAGMERNDLGSEIGSHATRLADPGLEHRLACERVILTLGEAPTASRGLDAHFALQRARQAVDLSVFTTPAGRGGCRRLAHALRMWWWRWCRYQHEWIVSRHNAVTAQLGYLLEFERDERRRQVAALEERIAALEHAAGQEPAGDRT